VNGSSAPLGASASRCPNNHGLTPPAPEIGTALQAHAARIPDQRARAATDGPADSICAASKASMVEGRFQEEELGAGRREAVALRVMTPARISSRARQFLEV